MEKFVLKSDIPVFCLLIPDFPNGIEQGFKTLIAQFGNVGRTYYGVSYMDESGNIIYKAAVSQAKEDADKKTDLESFTIKSGDYMSETLHDWMSNTEMIKHSFTRLMKEPQVDFHFPCVEWYKDDKEMICMVRMIAQK